MNNPTPHYVLVSETSRMEQRGCWRFILRADDGQAKMDVADTEPDLWGERLDLLTVVRALESLDQPSRVTLVGCSRYVEQGILYGIQEWKESGWRWEWFGQMVPVRDIDLWQRMDRLLQFHQVDCQRRRLDSNHPPLNGPHWTKTPKQTKKWSGSVAMTTARVALATGSVALANWVKYTAVTLVAIWGSWLGTREWGLGIAD